MTEMEVKQSKIILKYDDDLLGYTSRPLKMEPDTEYEQEFEEDYAETQYEIEGNDDEASQEMTVSELMQYVRKTDHDIGSNVVYIENGDIVQMDSDSVPQDTMVLEVEALADGDSIVQTTNGRT